MMLRPVVVAAESSSSGALHRFDVPGWLWIAFLAGMVVMLLVDLLVLHREAHAISIREASITSAAWIAIGVAFSLVVWLVLGGDAGAQYITGYVIEKSLSVDNVFVWAVIFAFFSVPGMYQHRVLFWGIFGALVLRAVFIFAGVALLERLSWLLFVFGGLLLFTAVRVATHDPEEIHPERNPVLRLVRRFVPVTADFHGQRLFTKEDGRRLATPLFVVLVLIEATDVVFAVDSVPAILAVSRDPFVVFSSNALAILGLRALYFLLEGARGRLIYLNRGLGVILFYVGVKMIVSEWFHIPTTVSLAVIAVVLAITVWLSLRASGRVEAAAARGNGP
ncbi:MAG TPA: TerC family protein [Acidimicrobiia bacterium]|jgi:tellurite resistance protein TerC